MVVEFLGERIGEPREAAAGHPHGKVAALGIGRADLRRDTIRDLARYGDHGGRRVAMLRLINRKMRHAVGLIDDAVCAVLELAAHSRLIWREAIS